MAMLNNQRVYKTTLQQPFKSHQRPWPQLPRQPSAPPRPECLHAQRWRLHVESTGSAASGAAGVGRAAGCLKSMEKNGRFGTGWEIIRISLRLKGLDKEWIMNGWLVSNMNFIVHFIYGMSSFPLTFIFLKMVETTNQAKQWQSVLDAWYRISCMFWYWITKFLVIDLAFFENEGGTHP